MHSGKLTGNIIKPNHKKTQHGDYNNIKCNLVNFSEKLEHFLKCNLVYLYSACSQTDFISQTRENTREIYHYYYQYPLQ